MKRKDIINVITHDMAWANSRRVDLPSNKLHSCQEILDLYRDQLYHQLASMTDDEIPKEGKDKWEFIHNEWRTFVSWYRVRYLDN